MKTIAKFFLKNKALSWLLLGLILLGGIISYIGMGKLEDAPFTIKQAVVTTTYPGASPLEVQQQVTDVLEEAIQSLGGLYYLKTENRAGLSKITVYVKKEIRADAMQQLWDKLRRKVGDAQSKLPAGAGTSVVNDDFGDVLGVFYALSSTTRTYRELEDQAERIKNELLDVEDVARVELFGVQNRTIEIEADPALLAASGVTMADIAAAFDRQNRVVDAGAVETAHNRLRVEASGSFTTLEELENLTVVSRSGAYFRLGEIAAVSEAYLHPARSLMQTDGVPAVGIAISTVADGNVVDMAERVAARIGELADAMPEGYHLSVVYDQGRESAAANDGFVLNLIISVVTVVAVLLFFIGMKNGILIGSGLVFSIFGTLIYVWYRHRPATHVAGSHHHCNGYAGGQCHCGLRCHVGQYAARHAQADSHPFGCRHYGYAFAGSYAYRRTHFPACLPFAAHHGRTAFITLYRDCRVSVAQLGIGHFAECILRAGVRTLSSSGGAER